MRNPIERGEQDPRRWFQRSPQPKENTRIVFQLRGGHLISPEFALTTGQWWRKRPEAHWLVHTEWFTDSFSCELRSDSQSLMFRIEVEYAWRVADAKAAVDEKLNDVPDHCRKALIRLMKPVAGRHEPRRPREAEIDLHRTLRGPLCLPRRCVEILDVGVSVKHPSAIDEHVTSIETTTTRIEAAKSEQEFWDELLSSKDRTKILMTISSIKPEAAQVLAESWKESDERGERAQENLLRMLKEGLGGRGDQAVIIDLWLQQQRQMLGQTFESPNVDDELKAVKGERQRQLPQGDN